MEALRKVCRSGLRWWCSHGLRGSTRALAILGPWIAPKSGIEVRQIGSHRIRLDHTIRATRLMAYGCYERNECRLLANWLPAGGVAIDCGANVGYMTAQMARAVGPRGHVYAFEPSPTCIRALQNMVKENTDSNITVIPSAVAEAGRTTLYFETEHILSHGFGRIDVHPSDRHRNVTEHEVQVTSLDDFFRDFELTRLDFVKIDVEGAEILVLRGMSELLGRGLRPNILLEISVGDGLTQATEIPEFLGRYGYQAFRVARQTHKIDVSKLSPEFHGNILFLPDQRTDCL